VPNPQSLEHVYVVTRVLSLSKKRMILKVEMAKRKAEVLNWLETKIAIDFREIIISPSGIWESMLAVSHGQRAAAQSR